MTPRKALSVLKRERIKGQIQTTQRAILRYDLAPEHLRDTELRTVAASLRVLADLLEGESPPDEASAGGRDLADEARSAG